MAILENMRKSGLAMAILENESLRKIGVGHGSPIPPRSDGVYPAAAISRPRALFTFR